MVDNSRPRRTLVVSPTLADGGSDRVALTLLRRLDRTKFQLSLALMRREGVLLGQVPADVAVHVAPARRLALWPLALARLIARLDPEIVFCIHGGANTAAVLAHALARSRARLVLSERSALVRDDRSELREAFELRAKRLLYPRADVVTAVSDGVARDLVTTLRLRESSVRAVYNPVVGDELPALMASPVAHPWFSDAVPIVLAVGRLVQIKDYPTLLDAFARVRRSFEARLAILGEGPLRAQLESDIANRGLANDVALLGFDPNPFRYMARATVLAQASHAEGMPGAIVQAMACGLPVVSTDCNFGPREVVIPGKTGFLVPVGNAEALAANITRLLADRQLARQLGDQGRANAARFAVSSIVDNYARALLGA